MSASHETETPQRARQNEDIDYRPTDSYEKFIAAVFSEFA
jgi:hypothetical protein